MAYAVLENDSGDFIIAGTQEWTFFLKADKYGNQIWAKNLIFPIGVIRDLEFTDDGNYLGVGINEGSPDKIFLIKFNDNGDTLWTKSILIGNSSLGYSVIRHPAGGHIVAAEYYVSPQRGIALVRLDANGDTLWTKSHQFVPSFAILGDGGSTHPRIIVGGNGTYYVASHYAGQIEYNNRLTLARYTSGGDTIWSKHMEIPSIYSEVNTIGMIRQPNGDLLIVDSSADTISNTYEELILRLDSNGTMLSRKTYSKPNRVNMVANSVVPDGIGNYVIVGGIEDSINLHFFAQKIDANNNELWYKEFGTTYSIGMRIINTADGLFAGCGWNYNGTDIFPYLVKFNQQGIAHTSHSNAIYPLNIFPNPTSGKFTVQGATGEIMVYDLFGRLLLRSNKQETLSAGRQVDMSGFPKGIYFVRVDEVVQKVILL